MHLFTSDWLQRMVAKSSARPERRIVNLFGILQDWLDAPGLREQLLADSLDAQAQSELYAYMLSLAQAAKLESPEKIAFQLQFMLVGALNDELRHSGSHAMTRAGEAAAVLVAAAKPVKRRTLPVASVVVMALGAAILLAPHSVRQAKTAPMEARLVPASNVSDASRPDRIAAIYQMHERLQSAQCSYPQALMLAPEQRALFLQAVVNIDSLNTASSNLEEVSRLYQKVECSYAPAAMLL